MGYLFTKYMINEKTNIDKLGFTSYRSNIPVKMIYAVICSQFCRFASICKYRDDFIFNCKLMKSKILNNGCPVSVLRKFVNKFFYTKKLTVKKFGQNFDFTLAIFN